jgi:predicted nuclease of predicted toxin-antitoxin system
LRFLADENFPGAAVRALRGAGHDVSWVQEEMPGAPDLGVIARAAEESRIILTFDKDFGELAFKSAGIAPAGVVLFRVLAASPDELAARTVDLISSRTDWDGMFSVVDSRRLRMRPLTRVRR